VLLLPVSTPLLKNGDDLAEILREREAVQAGDILVVSSKAVATVEDAAVDLQRLTPSDEANVWSMKIGRSPAFCEAVLQETRFWNGNIAGFCPGAILTELRPEGFPRGTILTANAGLDESNVPEGFAIGWPRDAVKSVVRLRRELEQGLGLGLGIGRIGMILTDSCCRPRRFGVTAFALAVAGLDPLVSQVGKPDLFGKPLHITTEAIADQLATAANFLMGNVNKSIPAVIIRDHGLPLSDYEDWVSGIEPAEDIFRDTL
jgi:coenzyme F420-0:L-glutamate ligase/coenzyme F420-1:gamma-L-glutamate ligase